VLRDTDVAECKSGKKVAREGEHKAQDGPSKRELFPTTADTFFEFSLHEKSRAIFPVGKMKQQPVRTDTLIAVVSDKDFFVAENAKEQRCDRRTGEDHSIGATDETPNL
jgi:hypothetical protein